MIDLEEFADSGKWFDNRYKLLNPINTEGGTADVWLAVDVGTVDNPEKYSELEWENGVDGGLRVAIKIYRPKNLLDVAGREKFINEFKIVYDCTHSNLVQPRYFSIFEDIPYLVLPFFRNGSSELLIGNLIEEKHIWKYILDVASGLAYLHALDPPIIHQDVKPANVLIDDNGNYAITDFGISTVSGHDNEGETSGTLAYMAPERFDSNGEPRKESDIWGLGVTLYELMTNKLPFGENGGRYQPDGKVVLDYPPYIPSEIRSVVDACLDKDPGQRPTAEMLVSMAREKCHESTPKKKNWTIPLLAALLLLVGGGALAFFLATNKHAEKPPVATVEEIYNKALADLDSDSLKNVERGLDVMDSLAGTKYIPAIYQMGFTYGWYRDEKSKKRKDILGIIYDDNGIPTDEKYTNYMNGYFTNILDLNDSAYARINGDAAYRIGVYHHKNAQQLENYKDLPYFKNEIELTKQFYVKSRRWKELANDTKNINKIDEFLEYLKKQSY